MTFQRARSADQRAQRRATIVATAAEMLAEMPVAEISLNELSRRVGLAKSNVLRYVESREEVLLVLLADELAGWVDAIEGELAAAVDPAAPVVQRAEQFAAALAASLLARPRMCELSSASAAVLEHNISVSAAVAFKDAMAVQLARVTAIVHAHLPELTSDDVALFVQTAVLTANALWVHSTPPPAVEAAYAARPDLTAMRIDVQQALPEILAVVLAGLLARRGIR
ncbi:TetR/AcrR family transcriptional regulator [Pseudonocardia sp. CA-107938]|uniref:TetR/AcrR family transcriptional regulator n=1 Tax=Pseudonocardia sp. CA-107938 TaxID=3240021 RepID=UPI003D8DA155